MNYDDAFDFGVFGKPDAKPEPDSQVVNDDAGDLANVAVT